MPWPFPTHPGSQVQQLQSCIWSLTLKDQRLLGFFNCMFGMAERHKVQAQICVQMPGQSSQSSRGRGRVSVQLCNAWALCQFVSSFPFKAALMQLFQKWPWILGASGRVVCGEHGWAYSSCGLQPEGWDSPRKSPASYNSYMPKTTRKLLFYCAFLCHFYAWYVQNKMLFVTMLCTKTEDRSSEKFSFQFHFREIAFCIWKPSMGKLRLEDASGGRLALPLLQLLSGKESLKPEQCEPWHFDSDFGRIWTSTERQRHWYSPWWDLILMQFISLQGGSPEPDGTKGLI